MSDIKKTNLKLSDFDDELEEDPWYEEFWDDYIVRPFKVAILYPLQRLFRGYSEQDLWSADTWIMLRIRKGFKAYVKMSKKEGNSYPGYDEAETWEGWIKVLEEIDWAFDDMYSEYKWTDEWDNSEFHIESYKRRAEAFKLFGKFFGGFWD